MDFFTLQVLHLLRLCLLARNIVGIAAHNFPLKNKNPAH